MNKIDLIYGDCNIELRQLQDESVDLIFADPPYNLSGENSQTVKSGKPVKCDKGEWDKQTDIYDFTKKWVGECIRVLKSTGTLWVSGTLHSYPTVNIVLKEYGMWIINDVIWYKPNAPPLLSQNRFVPSTETIWVASKTKKYFFNYIKAKELNGGKQMRNLWIINSRRHKTKHPTEKPEELLERIIMIGSNPGDVVLDPFMGSGTTGVMAKKLGRKFIGMEISDEYYNIAKDRIFKTKISEDILEKQTLLNDTQ